MPPSTNEQIIGIVDYNTGNLHSVINAFDKIQAKIKLVSTAEDILKCDKILLPGVGAFGDAMEHLRENSLDEALKEFAKSGKYILGICLGAQVLFDKSSEFGENKGLSIIDGEIVKFKKENMKSLKIPHMGWNTLEKKENKIFTNNTEEYFYFVHSYHIVCDEKYIIATTNYGYEFASAVNKDNIYAIQPHPEKSHDNGLAFLNNFKNL